MLAHSRDLPLGAPRGPVTESRAGRSVRPASTMTAMPIASTGPIPRVARMSATPSTSIAAATVPPAARIAGAVRRAASPASRTSRQRETSSRQ